MYVYLIIVSTVYVCNIALYLSQGQNYVVNMERPSGPFIGKSYSHYGYRPLAGLAASIIYSFVALLAPPR